MRIKPPPKNIQSNPRLRRYEQFNPAKLPTRGRPLIVRSQPPYDDRCQSPMPSPREVKEMSCPGLVAKSGIAWTLRAGQDGQAGGGCYQDTRVCDLGRERCRAMPRGWKSFWGTEPRDYQDEGEEGTWQLGRSGGNYLVWCVGRILAFSSGLFTLTFSLWVVFLTHSHGRQHDRITSECEFGTRNTPLPLPTVQVASVENGMLADDGPLALQRRQHVGGGDEGVP